MSFVAWRAALVLVSGTVHAQPEVYVPSDVTTLAEALTLVNDGGVIVIESSAEIASENCVTVEQDVTIRGDGTTPRAPGLNIVSGAVTLQDLTLAGSCTALASNSAGSSQRVNTHLTVSGGTFTGNQLVLEAWDKPGMVVEVSGATITGLRATGFEVWPPVVVESNLQDAALELTAGEFSGNQAGSIRVNGNKAAGKRAAVVVRDCQFNANVGADAGDLYAIFGDVEISGSTFVGTGYEDTGADYPDEAAFLMVRNSSLVIRDTSFTEGRAEDHGAISAADITESYGDQVLLEGITANRVGTTDGSGGLLYVEGGPVTVSRVYASELSAAYGTLLKVNPGTTFYGEDLFLSTYEVGLGGAIVLSAMETAELHRMRFCAGRSVTGSGNVGIATDSVASLEITNGVFHGMDSPNGNVVMAAGGALTLQNNTFAGNTVRQLLVGYLADFTVFNNIFAHSPGAYGITSWGNLVVVRNGYNLWYSLAGTTDNVAEIESDTDVVDQEPGFWQNWSQSDCTSWPFLRADSPALNTGDPYIFDADGSRSDIGAFGGPDAVIPDEDGDGADVVEDCDDRDPARTPGGEEILGDGIDNDCDDATPDQELVEDSGLEERNSILRGGCPGCASTGIHGEIMTTLLLLLASLSRRSR